jgi:hypothetical protein
MLSFALHSSRNRRRYRQSLIPLSDNYQIVLEGFLHQFIRHGTPASKAGQHQMKPEFHTLVAGAKKLESRKAKIRTLKRGTSIKAERTLTNGSTLA